MRKGTFAAAVGPIPLVVAFLSCSWARDAAAQPAPAKPGTPGDPAAPAAPAPVAAPPAAPTPKRDQPAATPPAAPVPATAAPATEPAAAEATPATEGSDEPQPSPTEGLRREPRPSTGGVGAIGLWPQGQVQATGAAPTASPEKATTHRGDDAVLAEDWWSHARPVFEIHGFFRFRGELFHNFSLSRVETPSNAIFPRPSDDVFNAASGSSRSVIGPALCTPDEASVGDDDDPANGLVPCDNRTHAGANLRFRLDPELHVSDNLRVVSQIDLLDNVVLGSTPAGYSFRPDEAGGYAVNDRRGAASLGVFDDNISAPTSGVNSLDDSIRVKRAWGEYATPVGELRFGRMPDHFGLGILHNSGDGYDDDYQSTIDRLQFVTAMKPLDLYLGGSWDFPNEGPTSGSSLGGGQPYDRAQLDDVNQWSLLVMRKQSDELAKNALAHEQLVLDLGAYVTLRKQLLANDRTGGGGGSTDGVNVPGESPEALADGFARRGATLWVPDVWLRLRYKKFRFEAEGVAVLGSIESTDREGVGAQAFATNDLDRTVRQFGLATEIEQTLVEDRLRLGFDFGWASGDPDAFNPDTTNNLAAGPLEQQVNDDTISTFRFHPAYRVDLILHRNILQRVQGTYYFRPSVEYDFMRKASGQRLGGGAGVVWSRASEFVQTPGHATDLGIELNGRLYFQSKDGAINDRPEKMGGFYSMLEYGVLFPLGGMGYQQAEQVRLAADTSAAQILRLYLGVLF